MPRYSKNAEQSFDKGLKPMHRLLISVALATMLIPGAKNAQQKPPPPPGGEYPVYVSILKTSGATKIFGEAWVDNWFILHGEWQKTTAGQCFDYHGALFQCRTVFIQHGSAHHICIRVSRFYGERHQA